MIDRLIGKVVDKKSDYVVVQSGGFGFAVYVPVLDIGRIPLGDEIELFTHLQVREDAFTLFGFIDEKERSLFHLLITVTGVGPKVGIGILSGFEGDTIIRFIQNEDVKSLMKAPGIGKKTAERIILELKDKVAPFATTSSDTVEVTAIPSTALDEAYDALMSLGYSSSEAKGALRLVKGEDVETMIKEALKQLSTSR